MAVLTMTRQFKLIWHMLGSIHLTVVLCLMLTVDLAYGYICLNRNTHLFAPLNELGLTTWLATYGSHNLTYTAWFYLLLGLLTLLGVNTFVCTTDRVVGLIQRRKHFTGKRFFFKFAPHVMHYALIIILAGYLSSYLFAQVLDTRTLIIGTSMGLPGTNAKIALTSFEPEYYKDDRLPAFKDRVLKPKVFLRLFEENKQQTALLTCNHPIAFKGYSIFLKDFAPKLKSGGMNPRVRVDLIIRKDPGVQLYLAGILLFTAGLVMYLAEWGLVKKVRRSHE
jgi:hypothetical protein